MKTTIREQLEADYQDAASQIQYIKKQGHALFEANDSLRLALEGIENALRVIRSKSFLQRDEEINKLIKKLADRAERLSELRRMMELGAWSIEIDRAMQTLWENLP